MADVGQIVLLGAGGALVVRSLAPGEEITPPPPTPQPMTGLSHSAPPQSIVQARLAGRARMPRLVSPIAAGSGAAPNPLVDGGGGNWIKATDAEIQAQLKKVEAAAKKAIEAMDAETRARGTAKLNEELKLDPPLPPDAKWEDIARVAGGATGAAAGAALGGPLGAKVGAVVGAYLGEKIEDVLSENWDKIEAWGERQWDRFRGAIEGAIEDAGEAVEDAWNEVTGWF